MRFSVTFRGEAGGRTVMCLFGCFWMDFALSAAIEQWDVLGATKILINR